MVQTKERNIELEDEQDLKCAAEPQAPYDDQEILKSSKS